MAARWGSFLSQAVAGVESRLDNILAEGGDENAGQENNKSQAPKPPTKPPTKATQASASPRPSAVTSRSSSSNRANDRLQARLAKAVKAKSAQAGGDTKSITSPRSSTDSRVSVDRPSVDKAGAETSSPEATAKEAPKTQDEEAAAEPPKPATPEPQPTTAEQPESETPEPPKPEPVPADAPANEATTKLEIAPGPTAAPEPKTEQQAPPDSGPMVEEDPKPEPSTYTHEELETIKAQYQEEIQEYVEQIDCLQAKIQYLSNTAADEAKQAAADAPAGSSERLLAEKDEKIALLLEEGRKLSGSEQKLRALIRKLRTQLTENEKQAIELKKSRDKLATEAEGLRNRMSSEEKEKFEEEARKVSVALQREIDGLKRTSSTKDETIRRLRQEIKTNAEQAENAKTDALKKLQATELEKQKALEDTIASLKAEKEALVDKARLDTIEWQEKLDRAVERGSKVEEELKLELLALESKLEAMRAAAEEASSASGDEAQLKLLRQIETLQSQYTSAKDNWQGIESSMLAKAANLEKEKDEAQRRESEMRKKARDTASRCRRLEDELQDVRPALATAQQELETCLEQLAALRSSSKSTEAALEQARADLEKQRSASRDFSGEADRRQWDDVAGASNRNQSRPDSPLLSVSRTFSSDLVGLPVPGRPRRVPTPGSIPDGPGDGIFIGRRLSSQPHIRPSALAMSSVSPGLPPTPFSPFEAPSESPTRATPSVADRDDDLDDTNRSSPHNVAQDMISVSTVGAGPSVQLVERMSAAIRRLEAEKVAAKEEMARVCGQRDEARNDILHLMKDLEASKPAIARVTELEKEVATMNERYLTTLELLGEKSELVEELKADVQDVKAMYRELVQQTIK